MRHSLPPQGPPAGLWRRSDGVARSQAFRGELGGDRGSGPQVRDPDYRVEVAEYGVHIYDHDGHHVSDNPFKLFPRIGPEADIGHAFYLVITLLHGGFARRFLTSRRLRSCYSSEYRTPELVHPVEGLLDENNALLTQ